MHMSHCHMHVPGAEVNKNDSRHIHTERNKHGSTQIKIHIGWTLTEVILREARRDSVVSMAAHRKPTKKGRKLVVLECSEQRQMVRDGVPGAGGPRGGVSRYYTEKNVRNTPELLKLRKFNKYLGRHTLHVELK